MAAIIKILVPFLLAVGVVNGQNSSRKINPVIENIKTANHVNIGGTNIFVVPPKNFKISSLYTGLSRGDSTMLRVSNSSGKNYYQEGVKINRANYERRGEKVLEYQQISVNGYSGKYILIEVTASLNGLFFLFGDSSFTASIIATYPSKQATTEIQIFSCLNSVFYDPSLRVQPLANAPFVIQENNSGFSFLKSTFDLYVFSRGSTEIGSGSKKPFLIVGVMPRGSETTPKSVAEMMLGKAEINGFTNPVIIKSASFIANGYQTYECEASGNIKGQPVRLYYFVIVEKRKALVVQGRADTEIEYNLKDFKIFARAVRFKQ